jgi:type II secretory pathway pseudopilin PulG
MISIIKFLFVVAILGVLAMVLLPRVGNLNGIVKSQVTSSTVSNVQTVAATYIQRTMEICKQLVISR